MIAYGAIAGAVLGLVLVVATGQAQPQPVEETRGALAYAPATPREQWAMDFLAELGNANPNADTIAFVVAWQTEEGTTARFNPLATSQNMPGATLFNSHGVKNYATYEDGIAATVRTLQYTYTGYAEVLEGLRTNDPERALAGLTASPWAVEAGYGDRVRGLWEDTRALGNAPAVSLPSKCPYTDTMQVGEGSYFDSTGSPWWGGQYGGMHLGIDLVGNPGDPVYAPFDMHIESVGFYSDPGLYGANIQGRFLSDGVLYYAGHLIDTYVQGGQTVPACTVIGTLGATSQPHTHIKLAGAAAPVPCEGSMPGEYGCIDPLEYWRTH